MNGDPGNLLRPDLPPASGFTVAARPHRAKLDQNESSAALPESVREPVLEALRAAAWNRYPQPVAYAAVKERFAGALGLAPERVALTAGGDQGILAAFQLAAGAGRRARIFEPTYPMFAHAGLVTQTALDRVVLGPDFALTEAVLGDPVHLLALVSPNNPTGGGPGRDVVRAALARPSLVLLDEAYADYAGESQVDLTEDHANLMVIRSLSKALLAGVRLGYVVAHPRIVAAVEHLLAAPYHLSAFQLAVAEHFERVLPALAAWVALVVRERSRLQAGLAALGLAVWQSRANFLLFAVPAAPHLYQGLLARQVRVRNVSSLPGLDSHLRVTVGTPEENDLFLEALAEALRATRPG